MILSNILSDPLPLFSPSGTPIMSIFIYFHGVPQVFESFFMFFLTLLQIG